MLDTVDPERLDPYLDHLRALPFVSGAYLVADATGRNLQHLPQVGAHVVLETPDGETHCPIRRLTSHLSREVAAGLVHLGRDVPGLLVFAPAVGRDLGDLFAREGVNFMDLAGNCHLRIADRYIARIQGQATAHSTTLDKGLRAPSYAALLALLIDPTLVGGTTRVIATVAGVSPQTAADLRARLVEQGFIHHVRGQHRWAPQGWTHARDLWLAGWTTTLFPHLLVGRFHARERDVGSLEARLAPMLTGLVPWRWGGGAAADRLTHYYRGDRTVIYVEQAPADLARRLGLMPAADGTVLLVRSPGPLGFHGPRADTVHPLVVYADLLTEGHDRARDAAREIAQRYLVAATERP